MSEIVKLNGYDLKDKKAVRYYDTLNNLISDTTLKEGMYAVTKGYYSVNDGGGSIYNIVDAVDNDNYQETLSNDLYATLIYDDQVNVKQFGAYGDGTHDDTVAIQNAINFSNNIYIPSGTYMIKGQDDDHKTGPYNHKHADYAGGLHLKSNLNITGCGKLKAITTDSENYCILHLYNIDNVTIRGISIEGDKSTHTGAGGEYGHGVMILHCNNVNIENINVSQTWGDGIYVGLVYDNIIDKQNENINIEKVTMDEISRNGIVLSSVDKCLVKGCIIKNVKRKDPKAGIDIESEAYGVTDPSLNNIIIDECKFYDCFRGIFIYTTDELDTSKDSNIYINNCVVYRAAVSLLVHNQSSFNSVINGEWIIDNFKIIDGGWNGISVLNHYLTIPKLIMNNLVIQNCNQTNKNTDDNATGWQTGSGVVITKDGNYDVGNITINNPTIINTKETNYINKPMYIRIPNDNANVVVNSPIRLDGLRPSTFFNTLVHDTNEILNSASSYYEKLCNPLNYNHIYQYANVSGTGSFNLKSDNASNIADNTEFVIINNRQSGTLRIDLGSDVDSREIVYPFDNTNRYITTTDAGASMTIKKINGLWYAVNIIGTWSN